MSNASCMLRSYRSHVCTYGITQDKETLKSQPNISHQTYTSPVHRTEPAVFKEKKNPPCLTKNSPIQSPVCRDKTNDSCQLLRSLFFARPHSNWPLVCQERPAGSACPLNLWQRKEGWGGSFKQPGTVPCSEDGLQDVCFNEASGFVKPVLKRVIHRVWAWSTMWGNNRLHSSCRMRL